MFATRYVRPSSAPSRTVWTMRRSFAHAFRADDAEAEPARPPPRESGAGSAPARSCARTRRRGATAIAFPCPENAERSRPWWSEVSRRPSRGRRRKRAERRPRGDVADREAAERPRRHLLDAQHVGVVGGRELDHLVEERASLRRERVAVKEVPGPDEHGSTLLRCACCSRIRLLSRPGTTTSSPRRSRAQVPTSSSRRRASASASSPTPDGYRRSERFYPLSSRALRALAPAPAAEGGRAPRRDALARARTARRPASAVARAAAGGRPPPVSCAVGLHRARPAAAAHRLAP